MVGTGPGRQAWPQQPGSETRCDHHPTSSCGPPAERHGLKLVPKAGAPAPSQQTFSEWRLSLPLVPASAGAAWASQVARCAKGLQVRPGESGWTADADGPVGRLC